MNPWCECIPGRLTEPMTVTTFGETETRDGRHAYANPTMATMVLDTIHVYLATRPMASKPQQVSVLNKTPYAMLLCTSVWCTWKPYCPPAAYGMSRDCSSTVCQIRLPYYAESRANSEQPVLIVPEQSR